MNARPFVTRSKNGALDFEAISGEAQRPSMCFAAIRSEAQEAAVMVFRTRDLPAGQRT